MITSELSIRRYIFRNQLRVEDKIDFICTDNTLISPKTGVTKQIKYLKLIRKYFIYNEREDFSQSS